LILPELNISITPKPGDYYIFPPHILHGVDISNQTENRYSLIFNFENETKGFDFKQMVKEALTPNNLK